MSHQSSSHLSSTVDCLYASVTKPTCPAFSAWMNTVSIRCLKVTEKAIMLCCMASPSKLCAALNGQSNVGSMCDCKPCRSFDLLVLVEILPGVDSDYGTDPRRYSSVNSGSTLCPIFIKKVMLTKDANKLSSG